jgi:hypothetical protein
MLPSAVQLLPTPTVQDGKNNAGASQFERNTLPLNAEVMRLLPTPTMTDHRASGASYPSTDTHQQGTTLTDATVRQPDRWGDYGHAIARWEAVLGRPAPEPTEPTGKNGSQRLSPAFVEWMMGLPEGWIVDTPGLTRNEALKACGNGVVPQQAIAALQLLLGVSGPPQAEATTLLPTPNPFHAGNEEEPQEWRERRADVFKRTGTRHGPALVAIAKSIADGDPLTPDRYMPDEDEEVDAC